PVNDATRHTLEIIHETAKNEGDKTTTSTDTREFAAPEPAPRRPAPKKRPGGWKRALRRDWPLYSLAILPMIFLAIFRYVPMAGNIIAFRRFRPGGSIFGDEWVGTLYVEMFIRDPAFWNVFANTAIIGGLTLDR